VTDLRDQLADFEAAARRLTTHTPTIRLTTSDTIGTALKHMRQDAGQSLDGLALRLGISRSGVHKREHDGRVPTSALVRHARALGYDVALIPRRPK
jgi:DNA-binding transcriptional regulator YiaG